MRFLRKNSWNERRKISGVKCFIFFFNILINLAVAGLNRGTRDHLLQCASCLVTVCAGSVVTACRLVASRHVGSSFLDQGANLHPCTGRRILNHWTTREAPRMEHFTGKEEKEKHVG